MEEVVFSAEKLEANVEPKAEWMHFKKRRQGSFWLRMEQHFADGVMRKKRLHKLLLNGLLCTHPLRPGHGPAENRG